MERHPHPGGAAMSEPTEVKRLRGDLSWVLSMENNDKLDALLAAAKGGQDA